MPLRGSKVKPDQDIQEQIGELKKAQHDVQDTGKEIEQAQSTIKEIQTFVSTPSTAELLSVINSLQERIEQLESKQREAVERSEQSYEQLKRIVNQLTCGGIAGAVARTVVAPIDRAKILLQTQHVMLKETKYTGMIQAWTKIVTEEGFLKLWRGNATNVFRVIPYSATQFASYDYYKHVLIKIDGFFAANNSDLTTIGRLSAGAMAAITATSLTHPLDVIRLRLSVQPELKGAADAFASIMKENGVKSLFKGYTPTLLSLAPFIAINFATFDTLKNMVAGKERPGVLVTLGLGACSGIFAQTCCYPLDTVRRRMQLKGTIYKNTFDAFATILRKEGIMGFYKGIVPNAVKVVPNNAIRFLVFEQLKDYFGVKKEGGGGGGG